VERLPPNLRDALHVLAEELDDLGERVDANSLALNEASAANGRRDRRWRRIAIAQAAVLGVMTLVLVGLGALAWSNRGTSCGLVQALGTLDDRQADGLEPTANGIRIGREADRLGARYGCQASPAGSILDSRT